VEESGLVNFPDGGRDGKTAFTTRTDRRVPKEVFTTQFSSLGSWTLRCPSASGGREKAIPSRFSVNNIVLWERGKKIFEKRGEGREL